MAAEADGDDLVEAIGLATALRVSAREQRETYAQTVLLAYERLETSAPQLLPVARAIIESGLECALDDSQQVLTAILEDPAAPALEADYNGVLEELGGLAVIFVSAFGMPSTSEYRRLAAAVTQLMASAEVARPVWRILRRGRIMARRKPPAMPRCTEPQADLAEYYM